MGCDIIVIIVYPNSEYCPLCPSDICIDFVIIHSNSLFSTFVILCDRMLNILYLNNYKLMLFAFLIWKPFLLHSFSLIPNTFISIVTHYSDGYVMAQILLVTKLLCDYVVAMCRYDWYLYFKVPRSAPAQKIFKIAGSKLQKRNSFIKHEFCFVPLSEISL